MGLIGIPMLSPDPVPRQITPHLVRPPGAVAGSLNRMAGRAVPAAPAPDMMRVTAARANLRKSGGTAIETVRGILIVRTETIQVILMAGVAALDTSPNV